MLYQELVRPLRNLILAAALVFPLAAHAATITLSMVIGSGPSAQTVTSEPLTTDDASAASILNAYTATLDAGTPPNPACAPSCTPQQVLTSLAQQLAVQASQFAQGWLNSQAAAKAPTPAIVAPPQ